VSSKIIIEFSKIFLGVERFHDDKNEIMQDFGPDKLYGNRMME